MKQTLKPGIYQHYKGQQYRVFHIATHSETQEKMVVYQTLYGDFDFWVRPFTMFVENVTCDGVETPRFKYLGDK
ncbi:DUF1653 domain-containing protein [Pseudoalteromonas sp. MMG013]|uniref:DUF1653 domain-containing protein n=1 Tax=Pseudoalteromonas sp. MMG013 TaxID=2822687 RepID=UPI001B362856|nr:DUF1653 domain-containing protein [Pseudoalteromonas sp. MMG013]MBQ4863217.1 DUF1653 domain-containing protein [Pseudoalteromonas sp. MMG013]